MSRERTALDAHVRGLAVENRRIAAAGCHLVDVFREARTIDRLDKIQDFVRYGIRATESRISQLRQRDKRRSRHFSSRAKRSPELGARLPIHLRILRSRLSILRRRISILRQIADSAVWLCVEGDYRRIAPLFQEGTHTLPTDFGMAGPLQLKQVLQDSGFFFVIENDLTRCLGIGDLTLLRADMRPATPLAIEVKTHSAGKTLAEGVQVGIIAITAHSDFPLDIETYERFEKLFRPDKTITPQISQRGERQAAEILKRTERIVQLSNSPAVKIAPTKLDSWQSVAQVLASAMIRGYAFDVPERGVVLFAVRTIPDEDARPNAKAVHDFLKASGVPYEGGASSDLEAAESLSGLVPPIPTWHLSEDQRVPLLTHEVACGVCIEAGLIEKLFSEYGYEFSAESGWKIERAGKAYMLSELEVSAAKLRMVIGAERPQELIASIVKAIESED